MAGPKVLRLGRHMKLLIPCASDPCLGPAADVGQNGVSDAGLVPEEPADGVALLAGALQEVGIGEPLEGWGHKSVRIEGQGIRYNSLQIHTHTPLLAIVALTFYASLILWLVPETPCTWHWAGRIARVQNRLNYLGGNGRGPHGGVHCRAKGGRAHESTGIRIYCTTLWSPAAAVADGTQDEPVRPRSGGRYLGPSSQFPRNRARAAEPRHGPPPGHKPRCPLARTQPLAAGGRLCPNVSRDSPHRPRNAPGAAGAGVRAPAAGTVSRARDGPPVEPPAGQSGGEPRVPALSRSCAPADHQPAQHHAANV